MTKRTQKLIKCVLRYKPQLEARKCFNCNKNFKREELQAENLKLLLALKDNLGWANFDEGASEGGLRIDNIRLLHQECESSDEDKDSPEQEQESDQDTDN